MIQDGAKEHYSLDNNAARSESVEEAVALDRRLLLAWNGHPYHVIIDNSFENFEEKLHALEISFAKFLLIKFPDSQFIRSLTFKLEKLPPLPVLSNEIEVVNESLVNLSIDAELRSQVEMDFLMLKGWDVTSISLVCRKQDNNCSYWMKLTLYDDQPRDVLQRLSLSSYQNYTTCSKRISAPVNSTLTHFVVDHSAFTLRETVNAGNDAYSVQIHCLHCGSSASKSKTDDNLDLPDFLKDCGPTLYS